MLFWTKPVRKNIIFVRSLRPIRFVRIYLFMHFQPILFFLTFQLILKLFLEEEYDSCVDNLGDDCQEAKKGDENPLGGYAGVAFGVGLAEEG